MLRPANQSRAGIFGFSRTERPASCNCSESLPEKCCTASTKRLRNAGHEFPTGNFLLAEPEALHPEARAQDEVALCSFRACGFMHLRYSALTRHRNVTRRPASGGKYASATLKSFSSSMFQTTRNSLSALTLGASAARRSIGSASAYLEGNASAQEEVEATNVGHLCIEPGQGEMLAHLTCCE